MANNWTLPTHFRQYSQEGAETVHVAWNEFNNFSNLRFINGKFTRTVSPLLHISRSPKYDILMKTYFLEFSGFDFPSIPDVISGISLRLVTNRYGRITDETVQLCLEQELIGENRANLDLNPIKIYGGEDDLWGLSSLTKTDLQNQTFGVVVRFQSHPRFPHKDAAGIDGLELQIH